MRTCLPALAAAVAAIASAGCGLLPAGDPAARTVGGAPGTTEPAGPTPTSTGNDVTNPKFPGYRLVFDDEFDGDAVDETRWNVNVGPRRDSIQSRSSVIVNGGILTLRTYTDAAGVTYTGFLDTGSRTFSHGYFEARVFLSDAPGEWCAFFLYPVTSDGVEIDTFEHRFVDGDGWSLADYVQVGVNWYGPNGVWNRSNRTLAAPDGGRLQGAWRTYGVLWDGTGYTFYLDDHPVWKASGPLTAVAAPLYLTCEVLDHDWAGSIPPGGYGSLQSSTTGMQVDWVRVWQAQP
jgi:beta-glucanase (GH16 family)